MQIASFFYLNLVIPDLLLLLKAKYEAPRISGLKDSFLNILAGVTMTASKDRFTLAFSRKLEA